VCVAGTPFFRAKVQLIVGPEIWEIGRECVFLDHSERMEGGQWSTESPLKGKMILVVDDESDVLDSVEEELNMSVIPYPQGADYRTQVVP
jgi:hypothetical protein